jgi:uncharacterized membrane protein
VAAEPRPARGLYHACMTLSHRRLGTLAALALASVLCVGLLAFRERYPHGSEFRFLVWNLFLAWIPFALALTLYDVERRGRRMRVLLPLAAAWLLFLPNAPYIVTDFVHVGRVDGFPVWYDAAMIACFAATGLVLGLGSVMVVQGMLERRYGPAVGWITLVPIFLLCSAGIYIGRVHRFNSWDAVTQPWSLAQAVGARLVDPFGRPEAIVALLGLMGMLAVAYLVLYMVSDLSLAEPRRRAGD